MKKAIVLLSGGVDSTTCLGLAVNEYGKDNVLALNIHYGQRHEKEMLSARAVSTYYKVDYLEIDISSIMRHSDCSLLKHSTQQIKHESYAEQLRELGGSGTVSTYVPFRNGLMLSAAAALAISYGATVIYYGAHADDSVGRAYPDCTPEFTDAMNTAIYEGSGRALQVDAPLLGLTKSDVVQVGLSIGAPYNLTWSCISVEERILTLSGYKSIYELAQGDYVWGFTDVWKPSKVEKIMFNGVKPLYTVRLKDQIGRITSFKCTDDHRLMMRDGTYKMLCECVIGDRVMPAHPTLANGYLVVHPHNEWREPEKYLHRIVAENFGKLNEIVHHKDKNIRNNHIDNLEGMCWGAHTKLADTSKSRSHEVNLRRASTVKHWWENMTPEEYAKQREVISLGRQQNHTIIGIEYYGLGETFDIQTETHNFALEAQLFVHNCYEGGDKPCGTCGTCIDRANAFYLNGVDDPALVDH